MKTVLRLVATLPIGLLVLTLSACTVPFRYTSQTISLEIRNTLGRYVESTLAVPQEVMNDGLNFDQVRVMYTVRKTDAFSANIALYVSPDLVVDNQKGTGDENIINVQLESNETSVSGTVVSQVARQVLNNKQAVLVLGSENLSTSLFSSVFVDLTIEYTGTYQLFTP